MFKGLRTKIENEKQTGTGKASSSVLDKVSDSVIQQNQSRDLSKSQAEDSTNSFVPSNTITTLNQHQQHTRVLGFSTNTSDDNNILETAPSNISPEPFNGQSHNEQNDDSRNYNNRISELELQLSNVIAERDESNEQNAQLYQLIEKLRRNLEVERETNSSLTLKINDLEQILNTRDCDENQKLGRTATIPNISFNPDKLTVNDTRLPEDVEILQCKLKELQKDLSKKNRQLKIYQQNINDIRKTLQLEISDHNKSRVEIERLEAELRELSNAQVESRTLDNCELSLNGFSISDSVDGSRESNMRKNTSLQGEGAGSDRSVGGGESVEDKTNATITKARTQPDSISCKSTISVDELESNDLQRTGGKTNKEVSHEYLRNVLYRFLTSTDMETCQRMINAISVLMNFSQEQSAAIKKTLQARSSWLRLK